MPAAWGILSDEKEETFTAWLADMKSSVQRSKADWQPSCFVVDCCDALIGAIRYLLVLAACNCLADVHGLQDGVPRDPGVALQTG